MNILHGVYYENYTRLAFFFFFLKILRSIQLKDYILMKRLIFVAIGLQQGNKI